MGQAKCPVLGPEVRVGQAKCPVLGPEVRVVPG